MEIFSNKHQLLKSIIVPLALFIAVFCYSPKSALAIDDVKDCVNPEHYGVTKLAEIKNKEHNGELCDSCISSEDYEKQIQEEYDKWKEAVKVANATYTEKYNSYEKVLNEKILINEDLAKQDEVISEKFLQYEKALSVAYKQNYQGQILKSLILDKNMTETLNLKKYMDSTLEYITKVSDELKMERQKKQDALDELNSRIDESKKDLIDAASHINDSIPEISDDAKEFINDHGSQDFKQGRILVDKSLSTDWLIDVALYYVGTPYVWGGKGETGADCSGFTSMVYKVAEGKDIGISTSTQYEKLEHIEKSDLERGDILFMANPTNSSQEHVGIFLEGDIYIHNSGTGSLSRVDSNIDYFTSGLRVNE